MAKNLLNINWRILAICIFIVFAVAFIGSTFTKIDDWYYSIRPSITPPNWVFPIVWTMLFILIAFSLYCSWTNSGEKEKKKVKILFGINFALNISWSIVYFWLRFPLGAFIVLILLWISILSLIIFNWKICRKASCFLIPYLLWVGFAGILNFLSIR